MSKNLSKYAALHRLTNELNIEDQSSEGAPMSDDRRVVATVGAAVMTLGMGMTELATSNELPEEQVGKLLELAGNLAVHTAVGFDTLVDIDKTSIGVSIAGDIAQDVEGVDIFTMGLREVSSYVAERPKPIPLAEQAVPASE
jgi:hypothetical protein